MSTLVLVMAAGMMLGEGPAKVSGEMEQGLELSGEWEGLWHDGKSGRCLQLQISGGVMTGDCGDVNLAPLSVNRVVDEGSGKFHLSWPKKEVAFGIYKQDGDCVTLCCSHPGQGRPNDFRVNDHQHVIILYRVKPRK
jgi:hypothetical protein